MVEDNDDVCGLITAKIEDKLDIILNLSLYS